MAAIDPTDPTPGTRKLPPEPYLKEWDSVVFRLQRENAQLRAALEQIRDENWAPKLTAIAARALEQP